MKKQIFSILFFTSTIAFAQFTVRDFMAMESLSNPQVSPDGKWILYTKASKKDWTAKANSDLFLIAIDKTTPVQLTFSEKSESDAQWSPDGKQIAFLCNRGENTQVFLMNISGGEAKAITSVKKGVSAFTWAGNNAIAYLMDEERDSSLVKHEKDAGGGWIFGTENNMNALWLQNINETKAKKVTDGTFYIPEFSASADGKKFALVKSKNSARYYHYVGTEIVVVDANGQALYNFNKARVFSIPAFSPDGNKLAFVACETGNAEFDALFIADLQKKTEKNYTHDLSPTILQIQWMNSDVYFLTHKGAYNAIYKINAQGLVAPYFPADRVITTFSIKNNSLAFLANKGTQCTQLYYSPLAKPAAKALTNINTTQTEKIKTSSKVIQHKSFDGQVIESVLSLPPGYKEGNKYPIMVLPHGGPDGIIQDKFNLIALIFAHEGFIVYEPNFRGSIGYGSAFYQANRGLLCDIDYKDIMTGLDHLIKQGMVDTTKMVVGGWSYGGFMTNWVIGHSNRFKAAVSVAGISNTVSMYATSDINHGELARWEFKGVPVTEMENFDRNSPIRYLENCKTPTLFLHGEADTRVPPAQAQEAYWALHDLGIDTKLVLYPGAGHGIRDPKQYNDVFNNWAEWYRKYLK